MDHVLGYAACTEPDKIFTVYASTWLVAVYCVQTDCYIHVVTAPEYNHRYCNSLVNMALNSLIWINSLTVRNSNHSTDWLNYVIIVLRGIWSIFPMIFTASVHWCRWNYERTYWRHCRNLYHSLYTWRDWIWGPMSWRNWYVKVKPAAPPCPLFYRDSLTRITHWRWLSVHCLIPTVNMLHRIIVVPPNQQLVFMCVFLRM